MSPIRPIAQNARNLYYANGFERAGQEATFLSYRELVKSIHVPPGREAGWRDFRAGFGAFASPSKTRGSATSTGIRRLRKFAASLRRGSEAL